MPINFIVTFFHWKNRRNFIFSWIAEKLSNRFRFRSFASFTWTQNNVVYEFQVFQSVFFLDIGVIFALSDRDLQNERIRLRIKCTPSRADFRGWRYVLIKLERFYCPKKSDDRRRKNIVCKTNTYSSLSSESRIFICCPHFAIKSVALFVRTLRKHGTLGKSIRFFLSLFLRRAKDTCKYFRSFDVRRLFRLVSRVEFNGASMAVLTPNAVKKNINSNARFFHLHRSWRIKF